MYEPVITRRGNMLIRLFLNIQPVMMHFTLWDRAHKTCSRKPISPAPSKETRDFSTDAINLIHSRLDQEVNRREIFKKLTLCRLNMKYTR